MLNKHTSSSIVCSWMSLWFWQRAQLLWHDIPNASHISSFRSTHVCLYMIVGVCMCLYVHFKNTWPHVSVLYMQTVDWCPLLATDFPSQRCSLTPLVPLAAPILSFNPSSWRGGQGDAHRGEKTVTVLHHGAPNDASLQPMTEEKMATGVTGTEDNMVDWWSSIKPLR